MLLSIPKIIHSSLVIYPSQAPVFPMRIPLDGVLVCCSTVKLPVIPTLLENVPVVPLNPAVDVIAPEPIVPANVELAPSIVRLEWLNYL